MLLDMIKRILIFCLLVGMPLLCGAQSTYIDRSKPFIADFPEEKKQAADFFLNLAKDAPKKIAELGLEPLGKSVRLVYCHTEKDFLKKSGLNPEHIVACAIPKQCTIIINGERFQTLKPESLFSVMIHEYSHVYIGQKIPTPLPRWLDEGLAMHLAGQWSFHDSLRLSTARFLGKTLPFSRLDARFPSAPPSLDIAYLQSYSFTSFIMNNFFGGGGLKPFMNKLKDPVKGPEILEKLWHPMILKSLEEQWKKSFGARWKNLLFILTSGTLLWFALASLFLYAYVKKRKQQKEKLKAWQQEDFF